MITLTTGEDRILVTYSGKQLLGITNIDSLDDELDVRTTLIKQYPTLCMNARLLDAHIYVCRRSVLDLLATRRPRDLDSMKEQVVPWLVKGSWQKGLSDEWSKSKSLSTVLTQSSLLLKPTHSVQHSSNPPPARKPAGTVNSS